MKKLTVITVLTVILTISTITGLPAQDYETITPISRIYNHWDHAYDIVVQGDYAYIAAGLAGLQIVDISYPEQLEVVGYWDNDAEYAFKVCVNGDLVYLVDSWSGVYILNVSDW